MTGSGRPTERRLATVKMIISFPAAALKLAPLKVMISTASPVPIWARYQNAAVLSPTQKNWLGAGLVSRLLVPIVLNPLLMSLLNSLRRAIAISNPRAQKLKEADPPPREQPTSLERAESSAGRFDVRNQKSFWNWGGHYIGYRLADSLYSNDGQQIGYFAEGDEVYACNGRYLGEVRTLDRLITNVKKKHWTRGIVVPCVQRKEPGCSDVDAKKMLADYEDFVETGRIAFG